MAYKFDKSNSTQTVTFYEERIYTYRNLAPKSLQEAPPGWQRKYWVKDRRSTLKLLREGSISASRVPWQTNRQDISGKWLYVFWSRGRSYKYRYPDWLVSRVDDLTAGQYWSARPGHREINPKPTNERAQKVWLEIWFDGDGNLYPLDISKKDRWKKGRHERPHPMDAVLGKGKMPPKSYKCKTVTLPLKRGGKEVRYFFLLSSIRLGKNALEACLKRGNADGMSIWTRRTFRASGKRVLPGKVMGPSAEMLEEFYMARKAKPTTEETKQKSKEYRALCDIGVVDPYHFAEEINHHHYMQTLAGYQALLADLREANPWVEGIHKRYLEEKWNRGSLDDLYFIAKALKALRYKARKKFDWDEKNATRVIRFVEKTLQGMRNAVEGTATMLCNWLDGPAHKLIDLAAVDEDLDKDTALGPSDRAYALEHWYNVTSLLGISSRGATFLASKGVRASSNPVQALLVDYLKKRVKKGKLHPKRDRITYDTVVVGREVALDLVLRWIMLDLPKGSGGKKAVELVAQKSKELRDVINASGFFEHDFVPAPKGKGGPSMQKYLDWSIFMVEQPIKVAKGWPNAVMKIRDITKFTRPAASLVKRNRYLIHVVKLSEWRGENAPSLWNVYAQKGVPWAKLFGAYVNLLFAGAETVKTFSDSSSGAGKRVRSVIDLAVGGGTLFDAIMEINGVDKAVWKKLGEASTKKALTLARLGVALSVIAIISAIWVVWTNIETASNAWDTHDTSVVLGASIAVTGGVMLALHGIGFLCSWEVGLAGLLASPGANIVFGLVIFVGVLIVVLTVDEEFENFVKSSFFAKGEDDQNILGFGDRGHWAGCEPGLKDSWMVPSFQWKSKKSYRTWNWPVLHQREALTRLLARFKFNTSAEIDCPNSVRSGLESMYHVTPPEKMRGFTVSEITFRIAYMAVPADSHFEILLSGEDHSGKKVKFNPLTFRPHADGSKKKRVSFPQRGFSFDSVKELPKSVLKWYGAPGFMLTIKNTGSKTHFMKLTAVANLIWQGRSLIEITRTVVGSRIIGFGADKSYRVNINVAVPDSVKKFKVAYSKWPRIGKS